MRTLGALLVVIAILFTAGTVATAAGYTGTQMMVGADASATLWSSDHNDYFNSSSADTLSATGNVTYYSCPQSGKDAIYFAYAGVKRTWGSFYAHPRAGYAGNWFAEDAGTVAFLRANKNCLSGFGNPYWYEGEPGRYREFEAGRGRKLQTLVDRIVAAFEGGYLFPWLRGEVKDDGTKFDSVPASV